MSRNGAQPDSKAVEAQVEAALSVQGGADAANSPSAIWNAVLKADLARVRRLHELHGSKLFELRGPVGELPLHLAFLYNSSAHRPLINFMLSSHPQSVLAQYEGSEYLGENCLHIAIVNRNVELVRLLLSLPGAAQQLLKQRAVGAFFQPGKPCYYGEYPLGFAVSTGQMDIADLLVAAGADLDLEDSEGNTLLHFSVLHSLPHMYDWLHKTYARANDLPEDSSQIPLCYRTNKAEMTAVALAGSTGNKIMYEHISNRARIVQWSYGPVSAVLYPLELFDNCRISEDEPRGALEFIVDNEQTELLMLPRVRQLLSRKWQAYGDSFHRRMVRVIVTLIVFSLIIIFRTDPDASSSSLDTSSLDPVLQMFDTPASSTLWASLSSFVDRQVLCLLGEIFILCSAVYKARPELRELINSGVYRYFGGSGAQLMENLISSLYCFTVFLGAVLRLFDSYYYDFCLACAVFFCWCYMLLFLLGNRKTGHFITMIIQMLIGDLLLFCLIWVVFLLGFSHAFCVLFDEKGIFSLLNRMAALFRIMLDGYDEDFITSDRYSAASHVLLFIYVILATILLLNLLVAMMSDTYAQISEVALHQWHLEWARICFSIEAEMDVEDVEQCRYWTLVDGKRYLLFQEVAESTPLALPIDTEPTSDEVKSLKSSVARQEDKLARKRTQLTAQQQAISTKKAKLTRLKQQLRESQDSLNVNQEERQRLQQERQQLEQQNHDILQQSQQIRQNKQELQEQNAELLQQIQQLQQQLQQREQREEEEEEEEEEAVPLQPPQTSPFEQPPPQTPPQQPPQILPEPQPTSLRRSLRRATRSSRDF